MKKTIVYILITILVSTQSSCKKDLNALPVNAKVDGNVIVDGKSAEVALNGAYYRFAEAGNDRGTPSTQWTLAHEIIPSWAAGYLDYPYGGGVLTINTLNSQSYEANVIWPASYLLINAANGVIKGVETLPGSKIEATRKKEIIAEAHFLRAYGHYRLLSFYGQYYDAGSQYGVMLRKEFVTTDNIAQPRSTVQESYDYILSDVDDAIANAPESNAPYYATQWAAKALKARILMNRGGAGDYEQVISIAKDFASNSPYQLEANLQDIFSTKGLDSKEVILGVTPLPNQVSKHDTYNYYGPGYIATNSLKALLQDDPRNNWVIGDIEFSGIGITKYGALNAGGFLDGPKLEVNYAFRLTEIYLLQAEATVRSGGSLATAKTILKTVMANAGVTDFTQVVNANTADVLLLEIYKETVKNMVCEDGQDWFALLRLPLETITTLKPTIIRKEQFIMPIPHDEFIKNNAIGQQNPGYDK